MDYRLTDLSAALADYRDAKAYASLYPSHGRPRVIPYARRVQRLLRARRRIHPIPARDEAGERGK